MSKFKQFLKACGGLDIVRECLPSSVICYTDFSDNTGSWDITITDGERVWRIGLAEKDIEEHQTSIDILRECLETGDVKFNPHQSEGRGSLSLSNGVESLDLQLVELPPSNSRAETKGLLFSVVKHMTQMRAELAKCKENLKEQSRSKVGASYETDPSSDTVVTRSSKATSRIKKLAGHSLINPSSKRRKAAVGVVFGDDD